MIELREITIEQAQAMMHDLAITLVDIRDEGSYQEKHIKNAVLLNRNNLDEFVNTADKFQPVICYCYHGNNSRGASVFLQEKGFNKVYSLIGGFEAWNQAYPLETA